MRDRLLLLVKFVIVILMDPIRLGEDLGTASGVIGKKQRWRRRGGRGGQPLRQISSTRLASNEPPITCHVLDTSSGFPAAGLSVTLYKMELSGDWVQLNRDNTNSDGRLPGFTNRGSISPGVHKMRFETGEYFASKGAETFYPYVEVVFNIKDGNLHYHVPLLLSPYGYSTYRGS